MIHKVGGIFAICSFVFRYAYVWSVATCVAFRQILAPSRGDKHHDGHGIHATPRCSFDLFICPTPCIHPGRPRGASASAARASTG